MVLENVKEMWTETPRLASGKKGKPMNKDRFISKMLVFLCSCTLISTCPPSPSPSLLIAQGRFSESAYFNMGSLICYPGLFANLSGVTRFLRGDSVILVLLS